MEAVPTLKQERLRQKEYLAAVELETARKALSEAQRFYNLARRRHDKILQEYLASKEQRHA